MSNESVSQNSYTSYTYYRHDYTAVWIGVSVGIFAFVLLLIGCCLFCFCRKKSRPGMVLNGTSYSIMTQQHTVNQGNVRVVQPINQPNQQFLPPYSPATSTQQLVYTSTQPFQEYSPGQTALHQPPTVAEFDYPSAPPPSYDESTINKY